MAEQYSELSPRLIAFIERQHLFFVASAGREGRVNVSPKGMDSLRVLAPDRVLWLNATGSGNETAAHVLENGRQTLMFCSFDKQPLILRLYGSARMIQPGDPDWATLLAHFPRVPGTRQLFELAIDLVQTSCGYAVPFFDYAGDRPTLAHWARVRGEDGIQRYWREKNARSLDGRHTGIRELTE